MATWPHWKPKLHMAYLPHLAAGFLPINFSFQFAISSTLVIVPKPIKTLSVEVRGNSLVTMKEMKLFLLKLKALSKKATTKFNQLSSTIITSMDMQAQLKVVFDLIDSNGDGKISPIELQQVMIRLGQDKSTLKGEIEGMVKELDLDGDGEIDFSEFTQAVTGGGPTVYDEALVEAFEVFDRDKNGLISARELRRVLVGLGYSKCSLTECRRMIRGVDKNGDGMVDFKEFKSMMSFPKEVIK